MLSQFIKGRGRHPGTGEINHDLIAWKLCDASAAEDVKGPEVGVRHNAPNDDSGCLFDGVNSDDCFDPRVRRQVVEGGGNCRQEPQSIASVGF